MHHGRYCKSKGIEEGPSQVNTVWSTPGELHMIHSKLSNDLLYRGGTLAK